MPPYKHVVFIQKIHWKSKTFVRFSFNKNKIIFFPDLWCYFSVSDSFSAGVCQHHICWLNNERLLGVKQLSRHQGLSNRTPVYYNNNNDLKSLVVSTLSQFQHNLGLKKRKPWGVFSRSWHVTEKGLFYFHCHFKVSCWSHTGIYLLCLLLPMLDSFLLRVDHLTVMMFFDWIQKAQSVEGFLLLYDVYALCQSDGLFNHYEASPPNQASLRE